MNKKRFRIMAVTAVVGCLLLSLSVTSFATSGSGYESYKEAIKSSMLTKNATVVTQFEVTDKGAALLSGSGTLKLDNENSSSKANITADSITQAIETSSNKGDLIVKVGDKYYQKSKDNEKSDRDQREAFSASSSSVKLAEMLTDTLVGDVKNQFVTDGQNISVNLEGAQIPELARLAFSAAAENKGRMENNSDKKGFDDSIKAIMDKMPKLNNIDVQSIAMTATVDGNTLKDNKFTVTITGKDEKGISHELTVMLNVKITDVGNTKTDTIDTAGKEISALEGPNEYSNR